MVVVVVRVGNDGASDHAENHAGGNVGIICGRSGCRGGQSGGGDYSAGDQFFSVFHVCPHVCLEGNVFAATQPMSKL